MARVDVDIKSRCRAEWLYLGDNYTPNSGYFIALDGKIPLWSAVPDLNWDETDIWLETGDTYEIEEGEMYTEPCTLMCRDMFGDMFTYGQWETLEEALKWLKNPEPLY